MYKILARKYRPERFSDVLEQEHVTLTLIRAIKTDKIGQAYLFSGPRGVGKTTVARVLVKTLNCENPSEDRTQCCGKCSFCLEITKGVSLDYQEIDGASHRGIDQIREIKNNLPYASANDKYRVFVIDEAHMLTAEAFNAMLKSLEEPPPKVIFILCTTESGKIPLTIRSRCQHFQFKLVSRQKLEAMLKTIILQEVIEADEDALFYIAKHAAGSMRDAQNLLEQVAAYSGGNITREKALAALGEVSKEVLYQFMVNLEAGSLKENYLLVEKLTEQGGSFATFLYECVAILSLFTYIQEGLKESQLFHISTEDMKLFYELCHRFKRDEIYKLLDCLFEFIQEFKNTTEERTLRDLALIKLHRYKKLISNEEIRESLVILAKTSDLAEESSNSPDTTTHNTLQATKRSITQDSSPSPVNSQQSTPSNQTTAEIKENPATLKKKTTTNPPAKHHSVKLKIDTWDERSYRSLMTLASRMGHAISKKLNQFRFERYDTETQKLVLSIDPELKITETTAKSFQEEFATYLQELLHQNLLQLSKPIPKLELTLSALVEQTEKIVKVFKDARIVRES